MKIARNSLLFLCRSYLQERQIAVLYSIQSQMYPTLDISVRFFGIDWIHIFRVSVHLKQCVDLMAQMSTVAFADVLVPRYNDFFYSCTLRPLRLRFDLNKKIQKKRTQKIVNRLEKRYH